MIRDNIKLYQNFSSFGQTCPLCSKPDQFFQNCSKLHFIPDRQFLISRLNRIQFQNRDKLNNGRKLKKLNSRKNLSKIITATSKIKEEDSSSESSEVDSKYEKKESFPSSIEMFPEQDFYVNNFFFIKEIFYFLGI